MDRADSDFAHATQSFLNWLKQGGSIVSTKIALEDLRHQNAGRGVLAVQDIDENEDLFSIPRTQILSVKNSNLRDELKTLLDDPWQSLILTMIYEFHRREESPWAPYFAILPDQFDTLMFWSQEELNHLTGSAVLYKIGKTDADQTFRQRILPILKEYSDTFKTNGLTDEELLALCHRMGSTIMSYAFDLELPDAYVADEKLAMGASKNAEDGWEEDEEENEVLPKGMIPMADMLNADGDRNNARLFYEEDKVVMKSIKPIKASEEIFNDYGPIPTSDLLRRYGYTTSNYAQYDVVEISSRMVMETAQEQLNLPHRACFERAEYLERQDVLHDDYDIYHASYEEGQFPEELCILLNTLALPKLAFDEMKNKERLPKAALSTEAANLLSKVIELRMSKYPSCPPRHGGDKRRIAMAQQVIDGEKKVLQEASQTVNRMLQPHRSKRMADTFENNLAEGAKKARAGS